MGVPGFYRWISERYPFTRRPVSQNDAGYFNNMYIDVNGLLHPLLHSESDLYMAQTAHEYFHRVTVAIERLFNLVRPNNLLYLAIDGVAPLAKLVQQRERRVLGQYPSRVERKASTVESGNFMKPPSVISSENITAGTPFMAQISHYLKQWVAQRVSVCPDTWGAIDVVVSSSSVPGEGEQKLFDHIRRVSAEAEHDNRAPPTCVIHGLDADLVLLSLAQSGRTISLLREVQHYGLQSFDFWTAHDYEQSSMELLSINMLRDAITSSIPPVPGQRHDMQRLCLDIVLLSLLVGNDFLPPLPGITIRSGYWDRLLRLYAQYLPQVGYITLPRDGSNATNMMFCPRRLELFLSLVAYSAEKSYFNDQCESHRYDSVVRREKGRGKRSLTELPAPDKDFVQYQKLDRCVSVTQRMSEVPPDRMALLRSAVIGELNLTNAIQEYRPRSAEELSQFAHNVFTERESVISGGMELFDYENDNVQQGVQLQHKRRWYQEMFDFPALDAITVNDPTVVRKHVALRTAWLRTINWVLLYYTRAECPDWCWKYPYSFSPLASDLVGLDFLSVATDPKVQQLLGIARSGEEIYSVPIAASSGGPMRVLELLAQILPPQRIRVLFPSVDLFFVLLPDDVVKKLRSDGVTIPRSMTDKYSDEELEACRAKGYDPRNYLGAIYNSVPSYRHPAHYDMDAAISSRFQRTDGLFNIVPYYAIRPIMLFPDVRAVRAVIAAAMPSISAKDMQLLVQLSARDSDVLIRRRARQCELPPQFRAEAAAWPGVTRAPYEITGFTTPADIEFIERRLGNEPFPEFAVPLKAPIFVCAGVTRYETPGESQDAPPLVSSGDRRPESGESAIFLRGFTTLEDRLMAAPVQGFDGLNVDDGEQIPVNYEKPELDLSTIAPGPSVAETTDVAEFVQSIEATTDAVETQVANLGESLFFDYKPTLHTHSKGSFQVVGRGQSTLYETAVFKMPPLTGEQELNRFSAIGFSNWLQKGTAGLIPGVPVVLGPYPYLSPMLVHGVIDNNGLYVRFVQSGQRVSTETTRLSQDTVSRLFGETYQDQCANFGVGVLRQAAVLIVRPAVLRGGEVVPTGYAAPLRHDERCPPVLRSIKPPFGAVSISIEVCARPCDLRRRAPRLFERLFASQAPLASQSTETTPEVIVAELTECLRRCGIYPQAPVSVRRDGGFLPGTVQDFHLTVDQVDMEAAKATLRGRVINLQALARLAPRFTIPVTVCHYEVEPAALHDAVSGAQHIRLQAALPASGGLAALVSDVVARPNLLAPASRLAHLGSPERMEWYALDDVAAALGMSSDTVATLLSGLRVDQNRDVVGVGAFDPVGMSYNPYLVSPSEQTWVLSSLCVEALARLKRAAGDLLMAIAQVPRAVRNKAVVLVDQRGQGLPYRELVTTAKTSTQLEYPSSRVFARLPFMTDKLSDFLVGDVTKRAREVRREHAQRSAVERQTQPFPDTARFPHLIATKLFFQRLRDFCMLRLIPHDFRCSLPIPSGAGRLPVVDGLGSNRIQGFTTLCGSAIFTIPALLAALARPGAMVQKNETLSCALTDICPATQPSQQRDQHTVSVGSLVYAHGPSCDGLPLPGTPGVVVALDEAHGRAAVAWVLDSLPLSRSVATVGDSFLSGTNRLAMRQYNKLFQLYNGSCVPISALVPARTAQLDPKARARLNKVQLASSVVLSENIPAVIYSEAEAREYQALSQPEQSDGEDGFRSITSTAAGHAPERRHDKRRRSRSESAAKTLNAERDNGQFFTPPASESEDDLFHASDCDSDSESEKAGRKRNRGGRKKNQANGGHTGGQADDQRRGGRRRSQTARTAAYQLRELTGSELELNGRHGTHIPGMEMGVAAAMAPRSAAPTVTEAAVGASNWNPSPSRDLSSDSESDTQALVVPPPRLRKRVGLSGDGHGAWSA